MIRELIKIRFKQAIRATKGIGLFRFSILLSIIGFTFFALFKATVQAPNAYYISFLYIVLVALIQFQRPDKEFLKIHFHSFKQILFVEYVLLALPLFLSLLIHAQGLSIIGSLIAIAAIVNIDFKIERRSRNTVFQQLIPSSCFEWKSGSRSMLPFLLFLWAFGLITSYLTAFVPVVIFILGILISTFYEKGEPLQLILLFQKGERDFVLHKLQSQLFLFVLFIMPLIIPYLFFNLRLWYIPLVELFILLSFLGYLILLKYAFYKANNQINGSQVFKNIAFLSLLMPIFFLPIMWILTVRFYFKAQSNLKFYLNDYN